MNPLAWLAAWTLLVGLGYTAYRGMRRRQHTEDPHTCGCSMLCEDECWDAGYEETELPEVVDEPLAEWERRHFGDGGAR